MKKSRVFDLHCDLLSYLERDEAHTAMDREARCAIPQLQEGGVEVQTLAVFTRTTQESAVSGWRQVGIFENLVDQYPDNLSYRREEGLIQIALAFENASSFCAEGDDLDERLQQLATLHKRLGRILYVSMTWNGENRFGGGTGSRAGLKEDGMRLLDFLHGRNIAIDLSHASDHLGEGIFNYIDQQQLHIPVMASHSNFRSVTDQERNLPDHLAREIFQRGGIVGLNMIRSFVGPKNPDFFVKQLDYGLQLGGENHLCMGADFFHAGGLPADYQRLPDELFFPDFNTASCYPKLFSLYKEQLDLPVEILKKIAFENASCFFRKF